ncbi:MAG TPA: polysaccharide lyase family protein [Terriglobia bacterium]|nr:polysaccharide lyase family protein [Terriglobia bacterium]
MNMRRGPWPISVLPYLGVLAVLWSAGAACAAPSTSRLIWQIGKVDRSSFELNERANLHDIPLPVFVIGKSVAARDWPGSQPGSQNRKYGDRPYPYSVIFNLPAVKPGQYVLTVAVLLFHARVPCLRVAINGRTGTFYFHRKPNFYPGNITTVFFPTSGWAKLKILLPTRFLQQGQNRLVLTAVDQHPDPEGDSFLTYDAISLSRDSLPAPPLPLIDIEPTIFYKSAPAGIRELTDVIVTMGQRVTSGSFKFVLDGRTFSAQLSGHPDFGQQKFEFETPDSGKPVQAEVVLQVNGVSQTFRSIFHPKRKWTLDVVPNLHLDVGFTDYRAKIAEIHARNIDKLVKEIGRHPQMRFSLDGSWIVQQFMATRSLRERNAFLALARMGKISVPAQLANVLTGSCTLDELLHALGYSYGLHREFGIPFNYANITDIPSYTGSLPSVLSAAGIRYFAAGSNQDRGPVLLYGRWNERSPFWWEGPDGHKVLMFYARQYATFSYLCGKPHAAINCRQSLPLFLYPYETSAYKPNVILIYGTEGDNRSYVPGEAQFVKKWNSEYAFPRMVLTTFPDYFRTIDRNFGRSLETVRGGFGDYWEDGLGTDARYTAINRSNQQRAATAEELATIAADLEQDLSPPLQRLARMWQQLILYDEHTWTSSDAYKEPHSEQTVKQLAVKELYPINGRRMINAIITQSLSQVGRHLPAPPDSVVVFNPSNWPRSGLVEMDLGTDQALREYPQGTPVSAEILRHGHGYNHVRFLAAHVPGLGYRIFQITPSHNAAEVEPSTLPSGNVIENRFYRVTVDPATGSVASIFDKQLDRELVDPTSPYQLNQYLYVSGGDKTLTQIVFMRKMLPLAHLVVTPSSGGHIESLRKTPYGQILTVRSHGRHTPSITSEIMLFDDAKKIEFVDRLDKDPVLSKEAGYIAFPLAVKKPAFSYDIQNGWVNPARDLLKGANLGWFAVQHWVKVADPGLAVAIVPLDAPLVTLGDINRGTWPEKFSPSTSTIFSYLFNNYWHTNFRRIQSGDYTFRYVLVSGRSLSGSDLTRLGSGEMTPLEIERLQAQDTLGSTPTLPSKASSFLRIDSPNVVLESWEPSTSGSGDLLRLYETEGRSAAVCLDFPWFAVKQAWHTDAMGRVQSPLPVKAHSVCINMEPHTISTLKVEFAAAPKGSN